MRLKPGIIRQPCDGWNCQGDCRYMVRISSWNFSSINDDGSPLFGLDWDGTAVGYKTRIWIEGQELSVLFTNYDGQDTACASAAGLYAEQLNESGTIGFALVQDDCHFRAEI
jgi:hypothetical protein